MKIKFAITIFIMIIVSVSCNQDPIFNKISEETMLEEALVKGTPTNMVQFTRRYADPDGGPDIEVPILYVASGTSLHWYAKSGLGTGASKWNLKEYAIKQPSSGQRIIAIAATSDRLYALLMNETNLSSSLRSIGPTETQWSPVGNNDNTFTLLQTLYADHSQTSLFAGARGSTSNTYGILYVKDGSSNMELLKSDTSMLQGVAFNDDNFFLATGGKGIYCISKTDIDLGGAIDDAAVMQLPEKLPEGDTGEGNSNRTFMSIIKLVNDLPENNIIIAAERIGGCLYLVEEDSFKGLKYTAEDFTEKITVGSYATSALALWEDKLDPTKKMLVAGMQGNLNSSSNSSYTNGYVEFDRKPDGSFDTATPRRNPPTLSVDSNTDRYTSTIGTHLINHLFQAPKEIDNDMTFFASTQNAGLYSYRDRPKIGGLQWNAEN